ncbi:unnamed protein product [Phytomonas sp. EM1]|nr:unnamed protein product [Phytomonas sp. EM1]|eukprot:CCW59975.1 unnamed protein product [Phytomonas sp. isolate EM1]
MVNCFSRRSVGLFLDTPLRYVVVNSRVHPQKSSKKLVTSPSLVSSFSPSFAPDEFLKPVLNNALLLPKSMEEAMQYVNSANYGSKGAQIVFHDYNSRRCTLCDVKLEWSYAAHASTVEHQARMGILERSIALLDTYFTHLLGIRANSNAVRQSRLELQSPGSVLLFTHTLDGHELPMPENFRTNRNLLKKIDWIDLLIQRWWTMLNPRYAGGTCAFDFLRIPSMSTNNPRRRLWRLRFLLRLLRTKGILRDSIPSSSKVSFARSNRFERCEMLGDNIIKYVFYDRLNVLFPPTEGGVCKKLALIQQMLDSNGGLLALYDYLKLDAMIGSNLANNKSKADVIESLFGELQTFLWASEIRQGIDFYPAFLNKDFVYLRAMVSHVLHELAHTAVMWRVEDTLNISRAFVKAYLEKVWTHSERTPGSKSGVTLGEKQIIEYENRLDRHPYAPLPLLTMYSRYQPKFRQGGKEAWNYSRDIAPVRAGLQHEYHRLVSLEPFPEPLSMQQQYRRNALRVWRAKQKPEASTVGTNFVSQPSPSSTSSEQSLGASRYSLWRQHEELRCARQIESDAAEAFQLTGEELSGLMLEKTRHLVQLLFATVDSMDVEKGCSDFSDTPQPQNANPQPWTLAKVLEYAYQ